MMNFSEVAIPTSPVELPTCALQCLSHTIPAVGCTILDHDCQCASRELSLLTSKCMRANCTLVDGYQLVKYDAVACNRDHTSRAELCQIIALVAGIITFVAVILRVTSRLTTVKKLWWDDYFHIAAGILAIPLNVYAGLMAVHGIGKHLYDMDFNYAEDLMYWFYHTIWLWSSIMWLVKMSILCLYLRLFTNNKHFRWVIWGTFAFMGIGYVIILPMAWATCVPVAAVWDISIKNARCLNVTGGAYGNAAVNISTEIIILLLPIPMLKELQLPLRKKIPLFALFTSGIFVIAVACLRLPHLIFLQYNYDQPWEYYPNFIWSCAEMAVIQVVAAAPAIRTLFARGKAFLTQKSGSKTPGDYYSRSRTQDRDGTTSKSRTGTSRGIGVGQHNEPNSILHTTSIAMNSEKKSDSPCSTTVVELTDMKSSSNSNTGGHGNRIMGGMTGHRRAKGNRNGEDFHETSGGVVSTTILADSGARTPERGSQDSILAHHNFMVESEIPTNGSRNRNADRKNANGHGVV